MRGKEGVGRGANKIKKKGPQYGFMNRKELKKKEAARLTKSRRCFGKK